MSTLNHFAICLLSLTAATACATTSATEKTAAESAPAPAVEAAVERPGVGRLPLSVSPVRYDLKLKVDPSKARFSGEMAMTLKLAAQTRRIHFHAQDMNFSSISCEAGDIAYPAKVEPATGEGAEPDFGERVAICPEPLGPGEIKLRIAYDSPFDEHLAGMYRAKMQDGDTERWYAYTQFEAADARKAFPCLDEPRFKVPFRVQVSAPEGIGVFSNTPEENAETQAGWTTHQFMETKPLPTYLVAFVIGELDVVEGPTIQGRNGPIALRGLAAKGRGALLETGLKMAAELLPLLEEWFDSPYPYRKLDMAALLEFGSGAMENAGLITYREEILLMDPKTTPTRRVQRNSNVIAHEIAHQWFGNLVTMEWWDDLWLNEAFATWMAAKIVDHWRPEYEQMTRLLQGRMWVFGADALAAARAVRQPVEGVAGAENAFDGLTYVKGANVLSMIEQWLGPEKFQAGVRAYLKANAFGNATAADLFDALSKASQQPVEAVARSFLDRPGVPIVDAQLSCSEGQPPRVLLTQARYRPLGSAAPEGFPNDTPWKLPVCVTWPGEGGAQRSCVLLEKAEGSLELDGAKQCPAWVYPNDGESGYYRWSVPPAALEGLVRDARSVVGKRGELSMLEQTWAMVAAGRVDAGAWVRTALGLKDTQSRHVLELIAGGLGRLAWIWPELEEGAAFSGFVKSLMGAHLDRLGTAPKEADSEDDALLRPLVVGVVGHLGRDAKLLSAAAANTKLYVEDPTSLPADMAPVWLRLAAREGALSVEQIEAFLKRDKLPPAARVNVLRALGVVPPGEALQKALVLQLSDSVRAQDLRYVLRTPLSDRKRQDQAFTWLTQNFAAVAERLPSFGWGSTARLPEETGNFCTAESRDKVRGFFTEKIEAKLIKGGERALSRGVERADQCIAVRAAGATAVREALSGK